MGQRTGSGIPAVIEPIGGEPIRTGAHGEFEIALLASEGPGIVVSSEGYVTRTSYLTRATASREGILIDLWPESAPFSLEYFRQLARNGHDGNSLHFLMPQPDAPRFYICTRDVSGGGDLSSDQVENIRRLLTYGVREASGGRFEAASIQTGPWRSGDGIGVYLDSQFRADACGLATWNPLDGWSMTIAINRANCDVKPEFVTPDTARFASPNPFVVLHELGHVMGLRHTESTESGPRIMAGRRDCFRQPECFPEPHFSSEERFHAALIYSRPFGNLDIDIDPPTFGFFGAANLPPPFTIICSFDSHEAVRR